MASSSRMVIDYDICEPSKCNFECITSCPVNKQRQHELAIVKKNGKPEINEVECVACTACMRKCPLGAISQKNARHPSTKAIEDTPQQKGTVQLLSREEVKIWKHSPYIVDKDKFRSFSEADTIFARVVNDPSYEYYHQGIFSRMKEIMQNHKPGYSRIDFALTLSAWKLNGYGKMLYKAEESQNPFGNKYEIRDTHKMAKAIKQVAKANGAALVGISKLNRDWLYTHDRKGKPINIPEHVNNSIVMAVQMDLEALQGSPDLIGGFATGNGYSRLTYVLVAVAEFIRLLGYEAYPADNGLGRSVPLAIDAGLGQYGRNGLLITENYGSDVRICKIFTDMPLAYDQPIDFGVLEFCRTCMKCAQTCPSQSISYDKDPSWTGPTKSNNGGILKWYVNVENCYGFWTRNGGDCSTCMTSCPFTKSTHWSHKIVRFFIKHLPIFNQLWVKLDDLMGYGKRRNPEEFWEEDRKFGHLMD